MICPSSSCNSSDPVVAISCHLQANDMITCKSIHNLLYNYTSGVPGLFLVPCSDHDVCIYMNMRALLQEHNVVHIQVAPLHSMPTSQCRHSVVYIRLQGDSPTTVVSDGGRYDSGCIHSNANLGADAFTRRCLCSWDSFSSRILTSVVARRPGAPILRLICCRGGVMINNKQLPSDTVL